MTDPKYLPILQEDGSLVPRPRLMMYFASQLQDLHSILVAYNLALIEDSKEMEPFIRKDSSGKDILSVPADRLFKYIHEKRRMQRRMSAGHTVLEWMRDKVVHGRVVGLDHARQRVADQEQANPTENSVNTLTKIFNEFQPTVHFVALQFVDGDVFENQHKRFTDHEVVGMAKSLEIFVDEAMVTKGKGWDPIRLPSSVSPVPIPEFTEEALQEILREKP